MIRNELNNVIFYTFNNLNDSKQINHLFSTRIGGVSTGKFSSMNLSFSRGDDKDLVVENFRRISELGFPLEKMVFSDQIHEADVQRVFDDDCRQNILDKNSISGIDGLMTDKPGIVLVTFYADCVPLYFFDPVKKAIALSHAGWRGTLKEIGKITVNKMRREFGSDPTDILAGIGPSVCKDCFEVGHEIAMQFLDRLNFSSNFISPSQTDSNKSYIDLWNVNKHSLISAGVSEENIELPDLCTKCNPDIFYSHRGMGNERGGLAAFLSIRDDV